MKRFLSLFFAVAATVAAFAQTPKEIVSRMEQEMDKHENEGMAMTLDVKLPIIGTTSTKTWTLGDKMRLEVTLMGVTAVTWDDGVTQWTYTGKSDEIEIKDAPERKPEDDNAAMFDGITGGYDVSVKKETDKAWYLACKKVRSNKDKNAPKNMELVVGKGTYSPLSLTAKVSGMTVTMRDISYGVTEKQVTFNPDDYPGARIVDKRKK